MNESEIRQAISRYEFYHIIQLTENIATPGYAPYVPAQNLCMKYLKSLDLNGKRVLDIGCRDGLFSFAAESMGAAEIVGIDNDISKSATEFLIPFFKSKIQMHQMNVYDLKPDTFGLFDVVIFPGVLYHLRFPFWALKVIRDVLKVEGHLIIETAIWEGERDKALLFCPTDGTYGADPTSCTLFNEKGLVDTLKSIGFNILAIEYLGREDQQHGLEYFVRQAKGRLKTYLYPTHSRPITITRTVFLATFSGVDKDTFVMQYWEATHDFHSTDLGPRG